MSKRYLIFTCTLLLGLMILNPHAIAQQRTVKACQDEWRANKSTNQANGVTEKAYVAQCHTGGAPVPSGSVAPTAPASATAPPRVRPTQTVEGQKTAKACREEWQANKAGNQANGVTERAYVAQCRAGGSPTASPATSTAPAPTAAAPPVRPNQAVEGQKTAKECREEWQANKAANQANGVTQRAYVDQCRAGGAPVAPTAGPATPVAPAPTEAAPRVRPTQTIAGQKTIKACREEWQANKAANQANGVTERAYVDECRTGTPPTQPTAAPATPPATAPTPTAAPAAPAPTTPTAEAPPIRPVAPVLTTTARPAPTTPGTPAGTNEFSTEAQAKARCPSDTVVWVTLKSGVYHFAGTRYYGTTKNGAYMCEADTAGAGMHAAKNETHP
jgi:hypothetical protein